jgi:hypothetical protein
LKREDPLLYNQYRLDLFKQESSLTQTDAVAAEPKKDPITVCMDGLELFSELRKDHPALKYLAQRKIPTERYSDLYFCKQFYKWGKQIAPALEKMQKEEPRLIIPYRNRDGGLIGFTCRAFGESTRKYIELKLSDEEMIYGQDRLDFNKRILCVEGPIDSMFLPNCVAVGGASYQSNFLNKYKHKVTIVPDNDWIRNKQVCDSIVKIANEGFSVALFPDSFRPKDINKAIECGYTTDDLVKLIKQSTKQGHDLLLDITFRRKC